MGFLWDRSDETSNKVGAPALAIAEGQTGRYKLVGFQVNDSHERPNDGAIIYEGEDITGYVCTCRYSQVLDKSIGLALVRQEWAQQGSPLKIYQNDSNRPLRFKAVVVPTPFYDPEGKRLRT
jgi:glycine cleavage system aminomethyltransferase T